MVLMALNTTTHFPDFYTGLKLTLSEIRLRKQQQQQKSSIKEFTRTYSSFRHSLMLLRKLMIRNGTVTSSWSKSHICPMVAN